jgi:hypothetical protein
VAWGSPAEAVDDHEAGASRASIRSSSFARRSASSIVSTALAKFPTSVLSDAASSGVTASSETAFTIAEVAAIKSEPTAILGISS